MMHVHEFQELTKFYEKGLREKAELEILAKRWTFKSKDEVREQLANLQVYLNWLREVMEQENLIH